MAARLFVTGTDTGVGKTVAAAWLTLALDAVYWKPVQTGAGEDCDTTTVRQVTGLPDERFPPNAVALPEPLSPHEAALRAAFLSLSANLDADARSQFVVQRMAPPGAPCVIRTHEDPVFGPVISFGLGGVMPELLNDRSYQVPPITDLDAARLIRLPGTSSLLFGHGGNEPADTAALEDMIVRLGLLADDFPQVVRLDLNPVVATPRGPAVLGAAAWVRPSDVREMEARRLTSW